MGQSADTIINILINTKSDNTGLKKTSKQIEKLRFDMNSLNYLFAGMALKKFGESFFKFAFNAWDRYEGYQSASLDSTMRLTAAWEFFRFSIFNALGESSLFTSFIDFIIKAANLLSEFVSKHPNLVAITAGFAALAVVLGGISMAGSILYQLWFGIIYLGEIFGFKYEGSTLQKALSLFSSDWTSIGKLVGVGLLLKVAWDLFSRGPDYKLTTEDFIKDLGLAALGGFMVGGPYGALAAFSIVFVFDIWKNRDNIKKTAEGYAEELRKAQSGESKLGLGDTVSLARNTVLFGTLSAVSHPIESIKKLWVELSNGTSLLEAWASLLNIKLKPAIDSVDDSLVTHSLVPSLGLLNEQFNLSIGSQITLTEKFPLTTKEIDTQSSSVSNLASAYERLATAMSKASSSSSSRSSNRNVSSIFG